MDGMWLSGNFPSIVKRSVTRSVLLWRVLVSNSGMHAPILVVGMRIPGTDWEGWRHRGYHRGAVCGRAETCVCGRYCGCWWRRRPPVVNCIILTRTISAPAAAVPVVVMMIPVQIVVMMPFGSTLPTGMCLVILVLATYLRTIDVEILNWFKPRCEFTHSLFYNGHLYKGHCLIFGTEHTLGS